MIDEPSYPDNNDDLVNRFEKYQAEGASLYFDEDEFIILFDHYLNTFRFDKSAEIVSIAKRQHPDSAEILDCEARLAIAHGNFPKAMDIINSALLLETNNIEVLLTKGKILLGLGETTSADSLFEDLLNKTTDPEEYADLLFDIGICYQAISHYPKAIRYLNDAAQRAKKNVDEIYYELGYIYEQSGEKYLAIESYEKALDNNPYSHITWIALGNLYRNDGQYDKAIEAFDYACTIAPQDTHALYLKGNALFCSNQFEEAIEVFEEYNDLAGETSIGYFILADCHANLLHYDIAESLYLRAIDLDGENSDIMASLCYNYMEKKDFEKALHWGLEAISVTPEQPDYYNYVAEAYINLENPEMAEAYYLDSLKIEPLQVAPLVGLGCIYLDRKEYKEAINHFVKAHDIDPEADDILIYLSISYYKSGEKELSQKFLQDATERNPQSHEAFLDMCPEASEDPMFLES